jgi:hypothetical protein
MGERRDGGKGGEMTQTLYAHMNKRKKKNSFPKASCKELFWVGSWISCCCPALGDEWHNIPVVPKQLYNSSCA